MPQVPDGAPAYQGRVVAEKAELDERLGKLLTFFGTPAFAGLDEAERARLRCQSFLMVALLAVLGERIEAFRA